MADKILFSVEIDNAGAIKKIKETEKAIGEDLPKSAAKASKAIGEDLPKSTEKASSGFSKMALAWGAVAAAFAAVKIGGLIRDAVSAASDQERVFVGLASSMAGVGVEYNAVSVELQNMLGSLQDTTRYSDTDAASALQRLVTITGNYGASLKLLPATLDFATAAHISLEAAAKLTGQAALGMTSGLSTYGVVLSDATKKELSHADAMGRSEIIARELGKRFDGAAAADLDTYGGRVAQLSNFWRNLSEALGDIIVKTSAAPGVFEKLTEAVKDTIDLVKDFGEVLVFVSNIDYDIAFSVAFDGIRGAAKLMVRDVFLTMSRLPDALGGAKFLEKALALNAELVELSSTMDRAMAPSIKKASDAANEFRDAVDNLTVSGGNLSDGISEGAEGIDDFGKRLDDLTLKLTDWEYKWKLWREAEELWAEEMARGVAEIDDAFKEFVNGPILGFKIPAGPTLTDPVVDSFGVIGNSFSDLISKGFTGELDSFADIWENIWADMAKSMTVILGEAFEDGFKDGGSIFKKFSAGFSNMAEAAAQNPAATALTGAGAIYSGYQQGGAAGVAQGAMGGAMIGLAVGSVVGMVVGAIVGGAIAYFGGGDDPSASGRISTTGGELDSVHGQEGSVAVRNLWTQQRVSEYRKSIRMMNDVLRLFGDGDLFDLIKDAPGWTFEGGSLDSLAQVFRERWLPSAMRDMFKQAINTGLKSFGVDDETRRQLWSEILDLSGVEQISALETYISSLVNTSHLMDDMDWNAIMDETRQDSMSRFLGGMADNLAAVQTQMLGLDSMTLLERAEQATTVEQLIVSARQAEIQMLMQIDQLQKSINDSIDAQIEGIRLGGMSEGEQQQYYLEQIQNIMAQLRAGVSSPEAMQALMADLQRYTGAYQNALGDSLYTQSGFGGTEADWIIGILEEARGLSNEAFEDMRDAIREANDLLIVELQRLIEALTHYGDGIATGTPEGPSDLSVTGAIDVNIRTSDQFWADVDARWEYNWMRRQQIEGGIN